MCFPESARAAESKRLVMLGIVRCSGSGLVGFFFGGAAGAGVAISGNPLVTRFRGAGLAGVSTKGAKAVVNSGVVIRLLGTIASGASSSLADTGGANGLVIRFF